MIWLDLIVDGAWEDGADEWALLGFAEDNRSRASAIEIIPAAANMHSFLGHVGGTFGIGRRTPTTESHT